MQPNNHCPPARRCSGTHLEQRQRQHGQQLLSKQAKVVQCDPSGLLSDAPSLHAAVQPCLQPAGNHPWCKPGTTCCLANRGHPSRTKRYRYHETAAAPVLVCGEAIWSLNTEHNPFTQLLLAVSWPLATADVPPCTCSLKVADYVAPESSERQTVQPVNA